MNDTWWVQEDQLDADQQKVALLPATGSYLVVGPPGSGKTNLLLLRAKYLIGNGIEDMVVLVFNRMLKEFATSGSGTYGLPGDLIKTSFSWAREFLKENGRGIQWEGDFVEQRRAMVQALEELIKEKDLKGRYEVILLDEAQDYWPEELAVFRHLAKRFFAVADARQKIYSGREPVEYLKTLVDEVIPLRYHYRIGEPICKVADALTFPKTGSLNANCQYDDESREPSVESVASKDFQSQCEALLARLRRQIKVYPGEFIGVLSPKRTSVRAIYNYLQSTELASLVDIQVENDYHSFDPGRLICVSTVHSAKGAEFRAVHFVDSQDVSIFDYHKNINFTAITRAKTALTLYHVGPLQPYLRQALRTLDGPTRPVGISDLFGKKDGK